MHGSIYGDVKETKELDVVVEGHTYYRDAAASKNNRLEEEDHVNEGAAQTRKESHLAALVFLAGSKMINRL